MVLLTDLVSLLDDLIELFTELCDSFLKVGLTTLLPNLTFPELCLLLGLLTHLSHLLFQIGRVVYLFCKSCL